jgi:hypothetical protein
MLLGGNQVFSAKNPTKKHKIYPSAAIAAEGLFNIALLVLTAVHQNVVVHLEHYVKDRRFLSGQSLILLYACRKRFAQMSPYIFRGNRNIPCITGKLNRKCDGIRTVCNVILGKFPIGQNNIAP